MKNESIKKSLKKSKKLPEEKRTKTVKQNFCNNCYKLRSRATKTQISDKKYKETLRMTAEKPRQQTLKSEVKMPHVKSCHTTKKTTTKNEVLFKNWFLTLESKCSEKCTKRLAFSLSLLDGVTKISTPI